MIETATRTRYDDARRAMIDSQLRTSGVTEPFVLARMSAVAREDHVPESQRAAAYADRAVKLPDGGFLPAPLFHGLMLTEARPTRVDRAIVVDAGSGYLPALLGPLVGSMIIATPADAAAGKPGMRDATLLLIDGAIEHLPAVLAKALAQDARVVTGVVERGVTKLAAGRKVGSALGLVTLAEVGVPRLPAFDREAGWSF